MSSLNKTHIPRITQQELDTFIREGLALLASAEPITCCAKVVWNDPYQLKYADPFGDGPVIRVNLTAPTEAGAFEEAEAILERRYPDVEWIIA